MRTIKLLTFNCFGSPIGLKSKKRFEIISSEIKNLDPDVVFLQEVVFKKHLSTLKSVLNNYNYFPENNFLFNTRGGLLILSKCVILDKSFHRFKNQGPLLPLSLTDRSVKKGVLSIAIRVGKQKISIHNVHTLHNYFNHEKEVKSLHEQLKQAVEIIERKKSKKIIIAGDFNVPPDSKEMSGFMKSLNLHDPFSLNPKQTLRMNKLIKSLGNFKNTNVMQSDYIFYKGFDKNTIKQKVVFGKKYTEINSYLSDHNGIFSEVAL